MSNGQRRGPGTWARSRPPVSRPRTRVVAGRPASRRKRLGTPSTGSCAALVAAGRQWALRSARKRRRYDMAALSRCRAAMARLQLVVWRRQIQIGRGLGLQQCPVAGRPPSRLPGQDDPGSVWGRAPPACSCADPLDSFHAMPPAVWEACLVRFEYNRHSFCRCQALQRPRPRPHPDINDHPVIGVDEVVVGIAAERRPLARCTGWPDRNAR